MSGSTPLSHDEAKHLYQEWVSKLPADGSEKDALNRLPPEERKAMLDVAHFVKRGGSGPSSLTSDNPHIKSLMKRLKISKLETSSHSPTTERVAKTAAILQPLVNRDEKLSKQMERAEAFMLLGSAEGRKQFTEAAEKLFEGSCSGDKALFLKALRYLDKLLPLKFSFFDRLFLNESQKNKLNDVVADFNRDENKKDFAQIRHLLSSPIIQKDRFSFEKTASGRAVLNVSEKQPKNSLYRSWLQTSQLLDKGYDHRKGSMLTGELVEHVREVYDEKEKLLHVLHDKLQRDPTGATLEPAAIERYEKMIETAELEFGEVARYLKQDLNSPRIRAFFAESTAAHAQFLRKNTYIVEALKIFVDPNPFVQSTLVKIGRKEMTLEEARQSTAPKYSIDDLLKSLKDFPELKEIEEKATQLEHQAWFWGASSYIDVKAGDRKGQHQIAEGALARAQVYYDKVKREGNKWDDAKYGIAIQEANNAIAAALLDVSSKNMQKKMSKEGLPELGITALEEAQILKMDIAASAYLATKDPKYFTAAYDEAVRLGIRKTAPKEGEKEVFLNKDTPIMGFHHLFFVHGIPEAADQILYILNARKTLTPLDTSVALQVALARPDKKDAIMAKAPHLETVTFEPLQEALWKKDVEILEKRGERQAEFKSRYGEKFDVENDLLRALEFKRDIETRCTDQALAENLLGRLHKLFPALNENATIEQWLKQMESKQASGLLLTKENELDAAYLYHNSADQEVKDHIKELFPDVATFDTGKILAQHQDQAVFATLAEYIDPAKEADDSKLPFHYIRRYLKPELTSVLKHFRVEADHATSAADKGKYETQVQRVEWILYGRPLDPRKTTVVPTTEVDLADLTAVQGESPLNVQNVQFEGAVGADLRSNVTDPEAAAFADLSLASRGPAATGQITHLNIPSSSSVISQEDTRVVGSISRLEEMVGAPVYNGEVVQGRVTNPFLAILADLKNTQDMPEEDLAMTLANNLAALEAVIKNLPENVRQVALSMYNALHEPYVNGEEITAAFIQGEVEKFEAQLAIIQSISSAQKATASLSTDKDSAGLQIEAAWLAGTLQGMMDAANQNDALRLKAGAKGVTDALQKLLGVASTPQEARMKIEMIQEQLERAEGMTAEQKRVMMDQLDLLMSAVNANTSNWKDLLHDAAQEVADSLSQLLNRSTGAIASPTEAKTHITTLLELIRARNFSPKVFFPALANALRGFISTPSQEGRKAIVEALNQGDEISLSDPVRAAWDFMKRIFNRSENKDEDFGALPASFAEILEDELKNPSISEEKGPIGPLTQEAKKLEAKAVALQRNLEARLAAAPSRKEHLGAYEETIAAVFAASNAYDQAYNASKEGGVERKENFEKAREIYQRYLALNEEAFSAVRSYGTQPSKFESEAASLDDSAFGESSGSSRSNSPVFSPTSLSRTRESYLSVLRNVPLGEEVPQEAQLTMVKGFIDRELRKLENGSSNPEIDARIEELTHLKAFLEREETVGRDEVLFYLNLCEGKPDLAKDFYTLALIKREPFLRSALSSKF